MRQPVAVTGSVTETRAVGRSSIVQALQALTRASKPTSSFSTQKNHRQHSVLLERLQFYLQFYL